MRLCPVIGHELGGDGFEREPQLEELGHLLVAVLALHPPMDDLGIEVVPLLPR